MMPRSIEDADAARHQEGERQGDQERGVEEVRRRGANDLLHDEGRGGTQHDHLAMRHVDDAHGAEGDGKSDGRQQQHGAERDAVPDILRGFPGGQRLAHRLGGDDGSRLDLGFLGVVGRALQDAQRLAIAAVAHNADRLDLLGDRRIGGEHDGGTRFGEGLLHARILLAGNRSVEQARERRVRAA